MITRNGFSKDKSIYPEGIVVTFGRDMMDLHGGAKEFLSYFQRTMADPDQWWMHKMKNRPTIEVADVYIITLNRLYGRVKFGWHENGTTTGGMADGASRELDWNRITLIGPFERCPFKRELKGFQGFRYSTALW